MVVSLRDAALVAETVVTAAVNEIRRDRFTGLVTPSGELRRSNVNVVASFAEDGAMQLHVCDAKDSGAFAYPMQEWSEDDAWKPPWTMWSVARPARRSPAVGVKARLVAWSSAGGQRRRGQGSCNVRLPFRTLVAFP
jgi:hypothetical protein